MTRFDQAKARYTLCVGFRVFKFSHHLEVIKLVITLQLVTK